MPFSVSDSEQKADSTSREGQQGPNPSPHLKFAALDAAFFLPGVCKPAPR